MNYLAHLLLAEHHPDAWIGNLMGDFVKGPVPDTLPLPWQQGIRLHRRIDQYTDQHPLFLRSKRRISPAYRRFAGILIDVFYDHILANAWFLYSEQSLAQFRTEVYAVLRQHQHELPPRMQASVRYIEANDLLLAYQHRAGIALSLQGLERRLRRPNNLSKAITELDSNLPGLEADFHEFFPKLQVYVQQTDLN